MSGPSRVSPDAPAPGENAQSSETTGSQQPLSWQRELDGALADLDSRLSHPRRRATDIQPTLPETGQPEITSEIIDEIAWRVAGLLRNQGVNVPSAPAVAAAITESVMVPWDLTDPIAPPPPAEPERDPLPSGMALSIRIRKPFFRWPFRRRRRRMPMISMSDHRIT